MADKPSVAALLNPLPWSGDTIPTTDVRDCLQEFGKLYRTRLMDSVNALSGQDTFLAVTASVLDSPDIGRNTYGAREMHGLPDFGTR
jgi:hypothetical protein